MHFDCKAFTWTKSLVCIHCASPLAHNEILNVIQAAPSDNPFSQKVSVILKQVRFPHPIALTERMFWNFCSDIQPYFSLMWLIVEISFQYWSVRFWMSRQTPSIAVLLECVLTFLGASYSISSWTYSPIYSTSSFLIYKKNIFIKYNIKKNIKKIKKCIYKKKISLPSFNPQPVRIYK